MLLRYASALIASTAVLATLPVVLYVGGILWAGDIGGPLNLLILPVASLILALVASACLLTPLHWIGERLTLPRWLLALVVLPILTSIAWSPAIWFYGFEATAAPLSSLLGMGGTIYGYLLIGLLAQFAGSSLLERWREQP